MVGTFGRASPCSLATGFTELASLWDCHRVPIAALNLVKVRKWLSRHLYNVQELLWGVNL